MSDHIETICVQGGYTPGNGEPRQIPIIQSTTFKYETSEAMGRLFDLEDSGYFYTRLQNPTCDHVAAKIAQLEGGTAGMLTSSGQAATFYAVFNVASCGDHVVSSSSIYGGTFNLFAVTMKRMGIKCSIFNPFRPVLSSSLNNRDHRKIVVIDGHTAFTGGVNLADEYINQYEKHGHWKDAGIMVKKSEAKRS